MNEVDAFLSENQIDKLLGVESFIDQSFENEMARAVEWFKSEMKKAETA